MTSKYPIVISITLIEETQLLVMIFWIDNTYDNETRKTFFYDKYIIRNFKLYKLVAEKTHASVKKFEKTISEWLCNKCF